jgi:hypothetical protein
VSHRDYYDSVTFFVKDYAPIADSKTRTAAALEPLYIAGAVGRELRQPSVDPLPDLRCEFDPLPGARRDEDDALHMVISRTAIIKARLTRAA